MVDAIEEYAFLSEWWSNSVLKVYMDEDDFDNYLGKEHTLAVLNHTYEIDWLILSSVMNNRDAIGTVRTYGKKSLQYYPVVGWTHYLSEGIFLCRSYDKDEKIIKEKAREYCDYPNPVTVFLCPEGTRYTKEKSVKSIEFAKSKNLPIFKHLLTIKTKGFTATLPNIRDKFGSILDITLAFDPNGVKPTMLSLLNGYSLTGHVYIKRYPMKDVPSDAEEAAKFLNDLFVQKDKLLESFFTTGSFFTLSNVQEIPPIEITNELKTVDVS
ncbi:1-acyl-sn-glycerol-3-phosphate acyltransferase 2-like [Chrysoperla carnea]|uniref:1-acyl-sn-glycerol-3-phosphate acyltransferase 2-like n=1 Tax=Chrysoperla carnea TaxID=189513 RepID=UPI001D089084|nr:1-acyl-sn-glycerol-3-phosphate acyltransferase 2-like [Chrysoperla carnea]